MFMLFFINGLAFFTTGFAIALENRKGSFMMPSGTLKLLAAYAFVGSATNFLQMVMSIQGPSIPEALLINLGALKLLFLAVGPILLLLFGVNLVTTATRYDRLNWLGIGLISTWFLFLLLRFPVSQGLSAAWISAAETTTRNLLYLPALTVSALGMLLHGRRFLRMGMRRIAMDSVWAATAFALKAIVSGAIGLPSPAVSATALVGVAGLSAYIAPVQLARTLATVGIAWFVIRIIRFLDLERRQQVDVAVQERLQAQHDAREGIEVWSKGLGRLMDAVSSAISSPLGLNEILGIAMREVLGLTQFEAGEIFLINQDQGTLTFVTQEGMPGSVIECERAVKAGRGAIEDVTQSAGVEIVPSVQQDPALRGMPCQQAGFHIIVRVPLKYRGTVLGTMNLFSRGDQPPEADELSVLAAVGQQIGVAIENARLYAEMQNMAVLQERSRLSRELHDGLAQVLGYLHLKSKVLEQLISSGDTSRAQTEASDIRETAGRAYEDVRESILGLRTTISPGVGLVPAVKEYTRRFGEQSGIIVNLMVSEQASVSFAPAVEVQLLRIIQEALTNARKHSGAHRVWVRFESDGDSDSVIVEDDGRGFELGQVGQDGTPRFGLQTMEERAQSVGGRLKIHSEPDQGTLVVVELPRSN
jgi:signal transduction histidine kinase